MIEVAVGYVGAYLARKALVLVDRVGSDADSMIDRKLGELYDWVKAKLFGRPNSEVSLGLLEETPEGEKQQALVAGQLTEALGGDLQATHELEALVSELDRLRPPGISIKGLASGQDVHGEQVGVVLEGKLPGGADVSGEARATTVHKDAKNIGVHFRDRS